MIQPRLADHIFMYRLTPGKLDRLLSMGYFRNANIMFQSQVLCLDGKLDDVLNIRMSLLGYKPSASIRKIAGKVDERFRKVIQKAVITPEKEQLYHQHRKRFKGFQFRSLEQLLFGDSPVRIFDTYEVSVYDGDRLIAFSFFDIGRKSIASILGVFDEAYSKYSLGLYTMYAEVKWAIDNERRYYYPGYILENNRQFDYKLRLGNHEFFIWGENRWGTREEFDINKKTGHKLRDALESLTQALERAEVAYEYKLYPYFSLGYLSLANYQFYVKSPLHIFIPVFSTNGRKVLLEYDTEEEKFVAAVVRENESYRQFTADNNLHPKVRYQYEWDCVLEYLSVQKYLTSERLVRELVQAYR